MIDPQLHALSAQYIGNFGIGFVKRKITGWFVLVDKIDDCVRVPDALSDRIDIPCMEVLRTVVGGEDGIIHTKGTTWPKSPITFKSRMVSMPLR